MMNEKAIHKILTYCIAMIWMANGLFCKVLNLVPRHQQIVATILRTEHARLWTIVIGFSEIFMAIWILSNIQSRLNAIMMLFGLYSVVARCASSAGSSRSDAMWPT